MRRRIFLLLFAFAVVAVIARVPMERAEPRLPFSVCGISLGESLGQIQARNPDRLEVDKYSAYLENNVWSEALIVFDEEWTVIGVQGNSIELGSKDFVNEGLRAVLSDDFWELIGEEDWTRQDDGDLTSTWAYPEHNLRVQRGCTGWYFFLGVK